MKKSKQHENVFQKIRRNLTNYFEIPIDSLMNVPRIEITYHNEATIFGCQKIIDYSLEEIHFLMKNYTLHIYGKTLKLMTYSKGVITVTGNIIKIVMNDSPNKDKENDICSANCL